MLGLVPGFMLPSPVDVIQAFVSEREALAEHAVITLQEAFIGLVLGVSVGFVAAVLMDAFGFLYKAFYPLLIITQTIPSVAIAPLLVLWFGYEMTPKVILIQRLGADHDIANPARKGGTYRFASRKVPYF